MHDQATLTEPAADLPARRHGEIIFDDSGLLRAVVEQLPDAIFIKDRHGRYLMTNPAGARYVGTPVAEVIGKTDAELLTPELARRFVADDAKVWASGRAQTFEDVVSVGGETRTLLTTKTPIRDREGNVAGLCGVARDITEIKRAEESLRESNALKKGLIEAAFDGVVIHAGGVIKCANQAYAEMLGYEVDELVGRNVLDLTVLEQKDFVNSIISGEPTRYEAAGLKKDGTRVHIEVSPARCLYEGEPARVAAVRDITERKRAEERLQESERRFRQLAENIGEVFWVLDPNEKKVLYVSPAYEEVWGRTCQSLYDRPDSFLDSVHPEDREAVRAADEQQRRGGRSEDEYRVVRPDGSVLWIYDRAFPIRDDTGRLTRVVGVAEDITERKRAEEKLKRLATAVEQSAESIIITDAEANILYVNPAFEHSTGYPGEEVLGRNPRLLKSGKQDQSFYRGMWETLSRGEVWAGRLINRKKDGTLFEEEGTISPIRDATGKVVNYVAVKRDVTREVALEGQLRQSQRMESVGRLAGGIAHDFNNLLTAINGYGDLALRMLKGEDPLRRHLEEIKKAGERATALTRQLLAFSRKQVLQPKVLDLNAVVSDLHKMLARLIGEDVSLRLSLDPQLGQVQADPGQIEQVIVNLSVNSRDAMPKGGDLTIETANVVLSEAEAAQADVAPGAYATLSVADTGCGMDEETLARVFEPFFTTKEVGKGTGLGLSTVYGIVRQSGGGIRVSSKAGRGTTFRVYLPHVNAAVVETEERDAERTSLDGSETILLV
jgi:PAS domain S-box-containing protein